MLTSSFEIIDTLLKWFFNEKLQTRINLHDGFKDAVKSAMWLSKLCLHFELLYL